MKVLLNLESLSNEIQVSRIVNLDIPLLLGRLFRVKFAIRMLMLCSVDQSLVLRANNGLPFIYGLMLVYWRFYVQYFGKD